MLIDFTGCERSIGRKYEGANGKKIGIIYNGEPYMVKFPVPPKNQVEGIEYSHYSNSCFSEYISCRIFNSIGIKAQETILGTYNDKLVVACKDFVPLNHQLNNFIAVKNEVIDSDLSGKGTELSTILEAIDKQKDINNLQLKKHFWRTFIVDSYVGNFDRHNGNWGIISSLVDNTATIAPIYDCGSTLYPQISDKQAKLILNNPEEINLRVFNFPNSAIKENGKKINYHDFLTTTNNVDCLSAIKSIVPRINKNDIANIIRCTPELSNLKKVFIYTMLENRYEKILIPSYIRAKQVLKKIESESKKELSGLSR